MGLQVLGLLGLCHRLPRHSPEGDALPPAKTFTSGSGGSCKNVLGLRTNTQCSQYSEQPCNRQEGPLPLTFQDRTLEVSLTSLRDARAEGAGDGGPQGGRGPVSL